MSESEVRAMFAEFGNVRSVLLKSPLAPQQETQHMSAITSMLPIYSMAYVNFDTEESAAAALALNRRNPMSKISVTYYERQPTQPVQMEADPRNATNYRILFITKMNKRVSKIGKRNCEISVFDRFFRNVLALARLSEVINLCF